MFLAPQFGFSSFALAICKERHTDPKRIRVRILTNLFSSFCCENIGYTFRFRHLSKCQPQMTLSIGNDYDVIFLPKWRTPNWEKINLGGHRFEWEAIPKDTYLRGKRTRIWGYSNFIEHGFVWRHICEERARIWVRTWIWVLHIYVLICEIIRYQRGKNQNPYIEE